MSHLYLPHISPKSPIFLPWRTVRPHISNTSPLFLPCISPVSHPSPHPHQVRLDNGYVRKTFGDADAVPGHLSDLDPNPNLNLNRNPNRNPNPNPKLTPNPNPNTNPNPHPNTSP